jgi:hypothetical protein
VQQRHLVDDESNWYCLGQPGDSREWAESGMDDGGEDGEAQELLLYYRVCH